MYATAAELQFLSDVMLAAAAIGVLVMLLTNRGGKAYYKDSRNNHRSIHRNKE